MTVSVDKMKAETALGVFVLCGGVENARLLDVSLRGHSAKLPKFSSAKISTFSPSSSDLTPHQ